MRGGEKGKTALERKKGTGRKIEKRGGKQQRKSREEREEKRKERRGGHDEG